jgi:D-3-phosphoglycerate dehydrogenase
LLDRQRIAEMKPGSVLINCARGGIVDEQALCAALQDGHLAAAHIDTFENEPYDGPLKDIPSATLSPHIGSYAVEGRIRMEREAVQNLIDCLNAGGMTE